MRARHALEAAADEESRDKFRRDVDDALAELTEQQYRVWTTYIENLDKIVTDCDRINWRLFVEFVERVTGQRHTISQVRSSWRGGMEKIRDFLTEHRWPP